MPDGKQAKDEDYQNLVRAAVLDARHFLRLTLSNRAPGAESPWVKVVIRPVVVRGRRKMQFSYFDGKTDTTKNFLGAEIAARLEDALALPFRQLHVQSTTGDVYVRIAKRGRPLISRAAASRAESSPLLAHDRRKQYLIPKDAPDEFLHAIGITDRSGKVRPAMGGKFVQVNEFLRSVEKMLAPERASGEAIEIVDCGCGRAYLTFAAHHYLNHLAGVSARVVGIDWDADLIAKCQALSDSLGGEGMEFRVCRIAEYVPSKRPDMVLSLHACDTATDEAIAQGILWGSRVIIAAPCCQHELHDAVEAPVLRPMLRHGILKQRTADILTDSFRALTLRIMGYRTEVVEFVDPEHTAKNLMIRARKALKKGHEASVREYCDLKTFWGVAPAIEAMLGEELGQFIGPCRAAGKSFPSQESARGPRSRHR